MRRRVMSNTKKADEWDVVVYGDPHNIYTPAQMAFLDVHSGDYVEIEWSCQDRRGLAYDNRNHNLRPYIFGNADLVSGSAVFGPFEVLNGAECGQIVLGGNYIEHRSYGIIYVKARIIKE